MMYLVVPEPIRSPGGGRLLRRHRSNVAASLPYEPRRARRTGRLGRCGGRLRAPSVTEAVTSGRSVRPWFGRAG